MLWKKSPSQPIEIVEELSKKIGVNKSIAELLVARGIYDFESAKYFFRPEWSHLHDPFLMKDMKEAVTRIQKAIDTGEGVMISYTDLARCTSSTLTMPFSSNHLASISPF